MYAGEVGHTALTTVVNKLINIRGYKEKANCYS